MKAYKYFYSKKQLELKKELHLANPNERMHEIHVNEVFISGEFVRYTEAMQSGSSNFDDAVFLGVHPRRWIRHNGIIQCEDLNSYLINNAMEK